MLTFYDPDGEAVIFKDSEKLRKHFKVDEIIQANMIIVANALEKQKDQWSVTNYEKPNISLSFENFLKKKIKENAMILAGICKLKTKSIGSCKKFIINKDISSRFAEEFFKTPDIEFGSFVNTTIPDIITTWVKRFKIESVENLPCKNITQECQEEIRWFISLLSSAYVIEKQFPIGFGNFLSNHHTRFNEFGFLNEKKVLKSEIVAKDVVNDVLDKLNNSTANSGLSVNELVKFLHRNPDDDDSNYFLQSKQRQRKCMKPNFSTYVEAWNNYTDFSSTRLLPCKNTSSNSNQEQNTYSTCCKMLKVIRNQKLSTILKVMKYSIQPVVIHEPLEDFLESFDNLDFLPFNNWTRYPRTKRFHLTEVNLNPMVYSCNYAERAKSLNNNCTLFHLSLTNDGMGYTFNNANFRDMYSTTSYMDLFSKIMRPKEYKRTRVEQIDKDGLTYPKGIEFTQGSGPTSGLEVHISISCFD